MEYLSISIALLATLVALGGQTWDQSQKGFRKLTQKGWVLAVLAVGAAAVSARAEYVERHRVALDDIGITLYAQFYPAYELDSLEASRIPRGFQVEYAWVGNYSTRLDFVGTGGPHRSGGYRSPARAIAVFHSANLRKNAIERHNFEYSQRGDLNGDTVRFRVPKHVFPMADSDREWSFRAELIIGEHVFPASADEDGLIEFEIEGL